MNSERGNKRKLETEEEDGAKARKLEEKEETGLADVVANHYNQVKQVGTEKRKESRIVFMRNLNNWIKSTFIDEQLKIVEGNLKQQRSSSGRLAVLDLCCGKGGDLKKWLHGGVGHVVFADIAGTSVEQCEARCNELRDKRFTAEYITADCTRVRLREKMMDVTRKLDLVSCQFAFHYCFESLAQVETMLKNASECLRTGGRFIGTIPNALEIVHRLQEKGGEIGNEVYRIKPHCSSPYPLFGAKYDFKLEEVVDCPEFLVHFPTLVKLAKQFGLKFIETMTLPKFVREKIEGGRRLLQRMTALERYPANEGGQLVTDSAHYVHAEGKGCVGTLSAPEWEVVSLYTTFVFEKVDTSWDAKGNPVYNI